MEYGEGEDGHCKGIVDAEAEGEEDAEVEEDDEGEEVMGDASVGTHSAFKCSSFSLLCAMSCIKRVTKPPTWLTSRKRAPAGSLMMRWRLNFTLVDDSR